MGEPDKNELVLKGREMIVAVCGGIAAYKVADVVSKLVQAGAGVSVVMTADATKFVAPLTFEALSGRKVRTRHVRSGGHFRSAAHRADRAGRFDAGGPRHCQYHRESGAWTVR